MTTLTHLRGSYYDLKPNDLVRIDNLFYVVTSSARGGMGYVLFLTKQKGDCNNLLGKKLALKSSFASDSKKENESLFRRELAIWAGFRNHNIVPLLDIIDGGDGGWLAAMDWHSGSLRDIINRSKTIQINHSSARGSIGLF